MIYESTHGKKNKGGRQQVKQTKIFSQQCYHNKVMASLVREEKNTDGEESYLVFTNEVVIERGRSSLFFCAY